jgi:hypothetical protein
MGRGDPEAVDLGRYGLCVIDGAVIGTSIVVHVVPVIAKYQSAA